MLDKLKRLFTVSANDSVVATLSPQDAHAKLSQKGMGMIDVREPDEYRADHVTGSTLMPLGTVSQRWQELGSFRRSDCDLPERQPQYGSLPPVVSVGYHQSR